MIIEAKREYRTEPTGTRDVWRIYLGDKLVHEVAYHADETAALADYYQWAAQAVTAKLLHG